MRRRAECGGEVDEIEMNNLSIHLPQKISINNVYSEREKEFMSDYSQLQMNPGGQSPHAVSNKYQNISENRRNYLKKIVKQK